MLHLGRREKPDNSKPNERYKPENTEENLNSKYKSPSVSTSTKILPNRSIKLKPIKNSNTQLIKVSNILIM